MATAADLGAHMYNWLSRNGYPVRQYTMNTGATTPGAAANVSPGQIVLDPEYQGKVKSAAARLGKRGRMNLTQFDGLRVLMHEALHQMRYGRDPGSAGSAPMAPGNPMWFEEGATEAATQDLLPIFARQMYGDSLADKSISAYGPALRNVRQLSVFGSGAKRYQDYKARVWRRQFLHADADGRSRMADAARAARVEWGKRAGR